MRIVSSHRPLGLLVFALLCGSLSAFPQSKPAPNAAPDVLVLSNGDTLHGKLVNSISGKVTFHSDPLGDITVPLDKIKELRTGQPFAVLSDQNKFRSREAARNIPTGSLDVTDKAATVHPANAPPQPPIPVENAQYIIDSVTLDKEVNHRPEFTQAWNGGATAGATIVAATQNQFTFSGGVGLVRTVPTVPWLDPRNRTSIDFTGSYGKITQPAYTIPGPPIIHVASVVTKTALYHADAERDEYFSPRLFFLVQTAFDHNFAQNLALQQIYGGGIGWTAIKDAKQELDLKGTIQYEKQEFITGGPGANQNLIGSTFSADYILKEKLFIYTQGLAYIPAYNNLHAWSVNETNTLAFPTYKNLAFSVGTLDSYLNNPPISLPPTKRNSFQFTMGLTYAIKSRY